MSWDGFYSLNQIEFINASRTEAYASTVGWFRPHFKNEALQLILGHPYYTNPEEDSAPWVDERHPVSREFYGVYPLDITGTEDSTQTAESLNGIGDGGVITLPRNAIKTMVFNTVLIAASEAGVNYGHQWLKRVLAAVGCDNAVSCNGHDLGYFASEPHLGAWDECIARREPSPENPDAASDALVRRLRRTVCTVGPQVTSKRYATDGGAIWMVTFTLAAGRPVELGVEVPFLTGWMDPAENGNPWPDTSSAPGLALDYYGGGYGGYPAGVVPVEDPVWYGGGGYQ